MSIELEAATRLIALKQGIESATGETYSDITDGVKDLISKIGSGDLGDEIETLRSIIERTAETIDDSVLTKIGVRAFQDLKTLKYARFANVEQTEDNALLGCVNLLEFSAPRLKAVGTWTFQNCTNLKKCSIPIAETFGWAIFENTALEDIVLPRCKKITDRMFRYCANLKTIVLGNNAVVGIDNVRAFDGTPFATNGAGGTVYVPAALIESYKTATNWVTLYEAGTCNFVAIEGSEYE